MDAYDIPMSGSSDDEPAEDNIILDLDQDPRITKLGSNIPIPSQSDMPGILYSFIFLLFRN